MADTSDVGIQNADIFREGQTEGESIIMNTANVVESKMN